MTIRSRRRPLPIVVAMLAVLLAACSGTDSPLDDRPYEVHVPPGYDEATPAPLLIVLHGYALEAKVQSLYFGLDAVTDPRGILYVAPEGTKNAEGKTFWNATAACCAPPDSDVDDSAYLAAVIAAVQKDYAVDDRRIFVLGHSNGGFMAYRLACDHADLIAGIVSLEGAMNEDSSACDPSEPVSVVEIHGTADTVIRYEGGRNDDADPNAPAYPSAAQSVLEWARFNGCDDTAAPGEPPSRDLEKAMPAATVTAYSGCRAGTAVELWTQPDGEHVPELSDSFTAQAIDFLLAHPKR
jgi:polyhydroxybutyrate depolymerase